MVLAAGLEQRQVGAGLGEGAPARLPQAPREPLEGAPVF